MPDIDPPIAHAVQCDDGTWRLHALDAHLRAVAERAASHAAPFAGTEWARLAGRWHDLGKYRRPFQRYIRRVSGLDSENAHIEGRAGRTTHSTAGALLARQHFGPIGNVLAYLIAGHHAGLSDWHGSLAGRLTSEAGRIEMHESLAQDIPPDLLERPAALPDLRNIPGGAAGFALWVRMLFSCLVDADFLDTEAFMNPQQASLRNESAPVSDLLDTFNRAMAKMAETAPDTLVYRLRAEVLARCRVMAAELPGLFTLTVPTGGGKTLSSMAFALEHARRYRKRRIVYVIPYTSIIEQTADVLRTIFGEAVIEHHSNAEVDASRESAKSRLACENWDAPIVVTTNVQFFESLFAARTSRCRKLHNLVDSIVVLDEAQLLAAELLQPILDVLNLLATHYGVTVVLSTATQPALATRAYFDPERNIRGLEKVREIVADPDDLYRRLERVEVHLPSDWHAPIDWETLAARLVEHDSVLAIVNTRRHARELHRLMPEGTLHLSALMCGAHRSRVIDEIKARLKASQPTRVVSTQLVEAGVNLDFPVVYRALAGLDSIAQAAGRCNREGHLDRGEVYVFVPPQPAPPGLLRKGEDACRSVLSGYVGDPLERSLFGAYFERLYFCCNLDANDIVKLLEVEVDGEALVTSFRTASDRFRLIPDEDRLPVVVLYRGRDGEDDTVDNLLRRLRKGDLDRCLMRKLQRYTVSIHRHECGRLQAAGDIEEIIPGLFAQIGDVMYHPVLGLLPDAVEPAQTWIA